MSLENELNKIRKTRIDLLRRTRVKVEEAKHYIKLFPERRNEVCKSMKKMVDLTLEIFDLLEDYKAE